MIRRTSALLVVFLLVLVSLLPLAEAKKGGGNGNGNGQAKQHVKRDKAVRQSAKETRRAAKLEAKAAKAAARQERRELRAQEKAEKKALRGSLEATPSVETTKLTGRENAFARITAKLWRMPESALQGLMNALTNIGKWIGLVPAPLDGGSGGSTDTSPTPSPETTPTPDASPTP